MNYIKEVPLYNNDDTINVIVEILEGSNDKNELVAPKFDRLECNRYIPLQYPFYYGSFPQTLAGDKDPLDMILFTDKKHKLLDLVKVDVIGAVRTIDAGDQDDKIICVESDCNLKNVRKQMKKAMRFLNKYKGKNADMKIFKKLASMAEAFQLIEEAHLNWRDNSSNKTISNNKDNNTLSPIKCGRVRVIRGQ